MLRNGLINAGLALASLLLTCALLIGAAEIVLRHEYGAVPPGPPESEWNVFHERRGWAMKPGRYAYFHVQAARRVEVAINELGLRQGPLAPRPRPGVERISIVGDSFVFGPPVSQNETITAQLQAMAGEGFEILNVAVPGYGTGQQLRLVEELRTQGYDLGDKLVMVFFTNDIEDNLALTYGSLEPNRHQPRFSVDADGNLQQSAIAPYTLRPPRDTSNLLQRSLALKLLRYQADVAVVSYPALLALADLVGARPRLHRTPGIISGWYAPQWEERWRVTQDVLAYAVTSLRRSPQPPELTIVFVPSPFQVEEAFRRTIEASAQRDARYASFLADTDRPQRVLRELAARLDVPFVDLTPVLRQAAAHSLVYFPREGHFTEAGCAIAARLIYEHVIRNAQRGKPA